MYRICICDDEKRIRDSLREIILLYSIQRNVDIDIVELDVADKLLEVAPDYDILLLDIMFNEESKGITIAEKLRENGNNTIIVLVTSFESMSIDGYRAEPYRFIVKPFTQEQIFSLLDACISKLRRTLTYVNVKSESSSEMIRSDRIHYIYSKQRQRHIVFGDHTVSTWQSMSSLYEALPHHQFVYAQKSFIVNLDKVDTIRNSDVVLTNGDTIPLGISYKETFMTALQFFINE